MRLATAGLVLIALALGAYLRFASIGANEMSADEGASWIAAAAPSITEVLRLQSHLNRGKAGLHDIALHEWMRAFGDSLGAMRGLSALAGTLAILLVFLATREILLLGKESCSATGTLSASERNAIAAVAALIFAVNLVTIKYSRELRMYPLMLALLLAQIVFFIRAVRAGGVINYVGAAVFTALALAIHLTVVFALVPEGIWVLYMASRNAPAFLTPESERAMRLSIAIAAGIALVLILAPDMLRSSKDAADTGLLSWIKQPPVWAPLSLFNKATGTFAFPVMAVLGAWGAFRGWSRARQAAVFALLWMWAPPLIVLLVSFAIRPVFVERYVVSSLVPFFILVAVGVWELITQPSVSELRANAVRFGTLVVVVALSLGHIYGYDRKPHDAQWGEAAEIAASAAKPGDPIAVAPGYAVNVIRYYLRNRPDADAALSALGDHRAATVVVISDQGVSPATARKLDREYPHLLAHLRGVVVRHR
jgi:4-amino-4-deoxy-L-arabinose transferase-like glycosyltransferase